MGTTNTFKLPLANWILLQKHVGRFCLAFIAFLLTIHAFGQQSPFNPNQEELNHLPEVRRVYIKTNPFTFLAGPIAGTSEYRIGAEFVGGERISYELHGSYLGRWVLFNSGLLDDTTRAFAQNIAFPGFRFQGAIRYYLFKNELPKSFEGYYVPSGIYISLHASYAAAQLVFRGQSLPKQDWTNLQIMGRIGFQFITHDHFGLDLFTGLGFKENTAVNYDLQGRRTTIDLQEEFETGLGDYIASPFKFALGFSFSYGIF